MSEEAERYRRLAAQFTERVRQVPPDAWDNPAPCEGWVARDVVRHLVEWVPGFLSAYGIDVPTGPSVDDDPVGAWETFDAGLRAVLDDPDVSSREIDAPMGRMTVAQAIDMIVTGDVFFHTWDLARATGLDETLDPDEVHGSLEAMLPYEDAMRSSGHYGPRVEVPDDADEQTKLLAFIGRRP